MSCYICARVPNHESGTGYASGKPPLCDPCRAQWAPPKPKKKPEPPPVLEPTETDFNACDACAYDLKNSAKRIMCLGVAGHAGRHWGKLRNNPMHFVWWLHELCGFQNGDVHCGRPYNHEGPHVGRLDDTDDYAWA